MNAAGGASGTVGIRPSICEGKHPSIRIELVYDPTAQAATAPNARIIAVPDASLLIAIGEAMGVRDWGSFAIVRHHR